MMEAKINNAINLIKRGAERVIDESELKSKLQKSSFNKKPLVVKLGVDPTAPDIHLGHTVPFRKLKHFQDLGHDVCFLIGDFTGKIGDPSGRDKTRMPQSDVQIRLNAQTYLEQVGKILDISKLKVVYNSHWLQDLNFGEIIKMAGQVTMSRLLEHNTFKQRLEHAESVRIHELLYPFMQGYDSVALKADVELGGSDQTFNLTFGRDLQKFYGQEPQVCITLPILTGTDGVQKMSKSLGNYIGINEPPFIMFDKIMRMTDANIINYYTLLTDVEMEKVNELDHRLNQSPDTSFILETKKKLAKEIITLYHSENDALLAYDSYGIMDKAGLPELSLQSSSVHTLADWMVQSMGIASKSGARRLMGQGAVKINNTKVSEDIPIAKIGVNDVIKIGKFKSFKITD